MEHKLMGQIVKEESFAQRRTLFKGIWDTAMQMGSEKEGSIDGSVTSKPKVIKTLRLDEIDRSIGRKKKQRIKNLRSVCNKILDFCNLQESEDLFYEKIISDNKVEKQCPLSTSKTEPAPLKRKLSPLKKLRSTSTKKSLSKSPKVSREVRKSVHSPEMISKVSNEERKKVIMDQIDTSQNVSEDLKLQKPIAGSPKDWKRLSKEDRAKINKKAAGIGRSPKSVGAKRIRKRKIVIPVTSFSFSGRRRTGNLKKKVGKMKEDTFSLSGRGIRPNSTGNAASRRRYSLPAPPSRRRSGVQVEDLL